MTIFRRPFVFLGVAALVATMLTACMASGPQKVLNALADALDKNDSAAFMAGVDLKSYAANEVKNIRGSNSALNSLSSLGQSLGLGNMDSLLGQVMDTENRLRGKFERGVSTGELMAYCSKATTPDCPWVPQALKEATVTELSETAAIAKVTTPARMTSWLALQKKGEQWQVVGQAVLQDTAKAYALAAPAGTSQQKPAEAKKPAEAAQPAAPQAKPQDKPQDKPQAAPQSQPEKQGAETFI